MRAWLELAYFTQTTKVKLPHESEFQELKDHPQSFGIKKAQPDKASEPSRPLPPTTAPPPPSEDEKSDLAVAPTTATTAPLPAPSPEEVQWLYLDDDGVEQGPFPHSQMQEWYKALFFTLDTKVRLQHQPGAPFIAIKDRRDCLFAGQKGATNAATTSISAAATAIPILASLPLMPPLPPLPIMPPLVPSLPVAAGKTRWFYLDDEDAERGPWSEKQMKLWCSKGFFDHSEDGSVKIRKEGDAIFRALSEWQGPLPAWALGHLPPKKVPGVSNRVDLPLMPLTGALPLGGRAPLPMTGFPFMLPPLLPEPEWTYLDKDGVEQGPWSSQQMRQWYSGALLSPQVRVREKGSLGPWTPIGARPCCFTGPPPLGAAPVPPPPPGPVDPKDALRDGGAGRGGFPISSFPAGPPPAWLMTAGRPSPADYAQTAAFSGNNRFSTSVAPGQAPLTHWEKRGLAPDSAGRQMSHYFDFDKWQEERNKASQKRKAEE
jgi:hypothetical protein